LVNGWKGSFILLSPIFPRAKFLNFGIKRAGFNQFFNLGFFLIGFQPIQPINWPLEFFIIKGQKLFLSLPVQFLSGLKGFLLTLTKFFLLNSFKFPKFRVNFFLILLPIFV